jgi:hypothetical protein
MVVIHEQLKELSPTRGHLHGFLSRSEVGAFTKRQEAFSAALGAHRADPELTTECHPTSRNGSEAESGAGDGLEKVLAFHRRLDDD